MKIVNIVPGFGGTFYCGNCLRDSAFVSSLRQAGHQAVIVPVYLPLAMDGKPGEDEPPVFYGAVNIYLKQQFSFLRGMPRWMENFFNSAALMKIAAKKAGSTRASGLEELTESMLMGEKGFQSGELQELVTYLKNHEKPDVVHFSNALLLGMAKQIREEVNVPVVCSLQDEDMWVDVMRYGYREKIWKLLSEKAADVDAFIAVSDFYARVMKEKMAIPDEKLHVVPIGISPALYTCHRPAVDPPAIGFLSRMYEENGLGLLVDAFIRLKSEKRFEKVRLHLSGGMTGDDKNFFRIQMKKLQKKNLLGDVKVFPDFTMDGLKEFFSSITLMSVPVLKGEAFGLYQLESMASGIPLVQPDLGAFPEIINATGGGMIYSPNDAETLSDALAQLLSDRVSLERMSRSGFEAVREKFDCSRLTGKMVDVYEKIQRK
jgi:glycosyltransferase involved in cell wall biosynthesis